MPFLILQATDQVNRNSYRICSGSFPPNSLVTGGGLSQLIESSVHHVNALSDSMLINTNDYRCWNTERDKKMVIVNQDMPGRLLQRNKSLDNVRHDCHHAMQQKVKVFIVDSRRTGHDSVL